MSEFIYINGKYFRQGSASVPVNNPGFLYGDGLFETVRSYKGNVYTIDRHLERLFLSLQILKYNTHFTAEDVKNDIQELLKKNSLLKKDAIVKIIVTRNSYIDRFRFDFWEKPNLIITAQKSKGYPGSYYRKGMKLKSSSIKRNALGNHLYRYKLLNYFENIYAKNEAYDNEADEAVFLTKDRVILEGASSNIFIVKRNMVLTPSSNQNILPGITRQIIIDLCRQNKIRCSERKLHYYNVIEADEMFITNSIMEVMPVCRFDSYKIGDGTVPGFITKKLSTLYRDALSCI
jgi:branched-chain amino acid aminotransferase